MAQQALQQLIEGNNRFASGQAEHPHQTMERRKQVQTGQQPIAAVLACADSRVSPEILFDQGIGDLFVVRNAGNVVDDPVLGSLEYAVLYLKTPLIVVLGHQFCGAVSAALSDHLGEGHIQSLIEKIAPAVALARLQQGDLLSNAVDENVRQSAALLLSSSPILADRLLHQQLDVVGARYDLDTGLVSFFQERYGS